MRFKKEIKTIRPLIIEISSSKVPRSLQKEEISDTRTMPAGHGGAEGKRCAYFVDERYLASLGLMVLEISYRIPHATIVPHNREITDWGLDL